jgi:PAS domain-containing protein
MEWALRNLRGDLKMRRFRALMQAIDLRKSNAATPECANRDLAILKLKNDVNSFSTLLVRRGAVLQSQNQVGDMPTDRENQAIRLSRPSDDQLRLIIDSLPAMVWTARPDGYRDFVNSRWLEYTGLSFEKAVGTGFEVVHPEDRPEFTGPLGPGYSRRHSDGARNSPPPGRWRVFLVLTSHCSISR